MVQLNYDCIVVGAGNAALCAAISAREKGARVLVLERGPQHKRGGNSFFTDGAIRFAYRGLDAIRQVIPSLSDEEAEKITLPEYSEEDYYDDLMRVTKGKSDPALARQLVEKSYETIKWMTDNGITFELNYENQSFEEEGKHHFWGGLPVKTNNKGVGLIKQLNERVKALGIEVWYASRAVKLLSENNQVNGLIVEQEGKRLTIQASSIILACGGFEANTAMRIQYLGAEWEHAIVRGTEYNTGDGLKMAMEVGAAPHGDWSGCHSIGTDANAPKVGDFTKPGDIFKKHSYPYSIMVNKEGQRFVDEGADFRNYTYAKYGREVLKQPGHIAFQIFDAKVRPMLRKEYELEETTVYKAKTLEALIDLLPVNKEQCLKTIETFNQAVQEGPYNPTVKDGKKTLGIAPPKSNWALPIDKAPFYAFPITCGVTFSFGGVHANTVGEVLNSSGDPIEGLFAAGEMIGGIFYHNYPGGSGLMSGAVFGRLAGESAARYAQKVNSN
ncbi:tricarballylate dehydrogenase [Pullulanibacillus camelliae]|uniref:Tricarballylate dehydrogenase n=1 Tax=Pullulanibacillus camelliae TaxID=1707096 RepID=A0A8J2VPH4_9BACL|nr:FAD-dependent tricarballylate dehydrogenase TcuA [Pullulanibacillus camelliae]GGE33090.1 tricarballylate dehydrogenase [Pullulanibacillus camelliae]